MRNPKKSGIIFEDFLVLLHYIAFHGYLRRLRFHNYYTQLELTYLKKYFDYQHLININISSKKTLKRFSNEDIRNPKFIVRFLPIYFVFYEKIAIFAALTEGSLRHCRIKNWKETRSFLIHSPFDTYPSQTSKNQVFTIREMILCGNHISIKRQNVQLLLIIYKLHKLILTSSGE